MQNSNPIVIYQSDRYFLVKMQKYDKYVPFHTDFESDSYITAQLLFSNKIPNYSACALKHGI